VVYLRHQLERAGVRGAARVEVIPTLAPPLLAELCAELRAVLPHGSVVTGDRPGPHDVIVLPSTRPVHRRFLAEKTRLAVRGLLSGAPVLLFYDVVARRAEAVPRRGLAAWYLRRLGEYAVLRIARMLGCRTS